MGEATGSAVLSTFKRRPSSKPRLVGFVCLILNSNPSVSREEIHGKWHAPLALTFRIWEERGPVQAVAGLPITEGTPGTPLWVLGATCYKSWFCSWLTRGVTPWVILLPFSISYLILKQRWNYSVGCIPAGQLLHAGTFLVDWST